MKDPYEHRVDVRQQEIVSAARKDPKVAPFSPGGPQDKRYRKRAHFEILAKPLEELTRRDFVLWFVRRMKVDYVPGAEDCEEPSIYFQRYGDSEFIEMHLDEWGLRWPRIMDVTSSSAKQASKAVPVGRPRTT